MVRHGLTRIPLIVAALFVVHSAFAASGITVEGRVVLDPPADGDVPPRIWVEGWGDRESIGCETDGSYRVELPRGRSATIWATAPGRQTVYQRVGVYTDPLVRAPDIRLRQPFAFSGHVLSVEAIDSIDIQVETVGFALEGGVGVWARAWT